MLNLKANTVRALLGICCLGLVISTTSQSCSANQFAVRNDNQDYMVIRSATEVQMCGIINICSDIAAAKQTLTLSTDGDLSLSSANTVSLPDNSPTNEIQNLALVAGQLSISGGNSVTLPDVSDTNEIQNLALSGGQLSISKGNSVQLPDSSATNELQTLSVNGGNLSISNGNSVDISGIIAGNTTGWIPLKVIPSKSAFGPASWPKASVKRVGDIVFMRGWITTLSDSTNEPFAILPDARFYPATWVRTSIYYEVQSTAGRAAINLPGTEFIGSLPAGVIPANSLLSFDGLFYSVA